MAQLSASGPSPTGLLLAQQVWPPAGTNHGWALDASTAPIPGVHMMQTQLVPGMQYQPNPVESIRSGGLTWSQNEDPTGEFEGDFLRPHATGFEQGIARQQELYP